MCAAWVPKIMSSCRTPVMSQTPRARRSADSTGLASSASALATAIRRVIILASPPARSPIAFSSMSGTTSEDKWRGWRWQGK